MCITLHYAFGLFYTRKISWSKVVLDSANSDSKDDCFASIVVLKCFMPQMSRSRGSLDSLKTQSDHRNSVFYQLCFSLTHCLRVPLQSVTLRQASGTWVKHMTVSKSNSRWLIHTPEIPPRRIGAWLGNMKGNPQSISPCWWSEKVCENWQLWSYSHVQNLQYWRTGDWLRTLVPFLMMIWFTGSMNV